MKFFRIVFLFALIPSFIFARTPFQPPESFADLVDHLSPAVVNIATIDLVDLAEAGDEAQLLPGNSPFIDFLKGLGEPEEKDNKRQIRKPLSLGSGFIIDGEKGYIVTNHHVIKDADEVIVILQNDKKLKAKIIGSDSRTDVALLQVKSKITLPAVEFGNASDKIRVGDWVLTIGNPYGFGGTVTAGIVSARARHFGRNAYVDYIQTDAPINVGNSGGPMFDMHGNAIGINTAIVSPTGGSIGIGFAIPSAQARSIIDELIENGYVKRGWIGVAVQDVNYDLSESLGLKKTDGALVLSMIPGGPAEKSGLKVSDVILEFNGKSVEAMRDLPRVVGDTKIDSTVPYIIWRNGSKKTLEIQIGDFNKTLAEKKIKMQHQSQKTLIKSLGITVRSVDKKTLNRMGLEHGIAVVAIKRNGPAAQKGMKPGDIFLALDQQPVTDLARFQAIIISAKKSPHNSILALVSRNGSRHFLALPLL